MKRLLDESTDELTRSLLAAGIEHRPPPGNKAQVIVAIGAGGALGLFSSNTFAWLGTTAGKVTAAGAAVGLAGAVFVAVATVHPSGEHARATAALRGSTSTSTSTPASASPSTTALAAPATDGLRTGGGASASEPDSRLAENGEPGGASSNDPSSAARRDLQAAPAERTSKRSTKARHVARNRSGKRKLTGSERAGVAISEPEPGAETEAAVASTTEKDRLDAEVRLIDEMHGAARRNDRDALARAVQTYRETFPDGQLKAEAAEFAAHLDGSNAP